MSIAATSPEAKDEFDALFDNAIVIDGLGGDIAPRSLSQHRAGHTAINVTVASPHTNFRETVQGFYTQFTYLDALSDVLMQVRSVADIRAAKDEKKLGIMFGLQDGSGLEGNLPLLTILYQLGLRVMTLTYNERNELGDGCMEPHDQGITNFGTQVVRDMERLGIVLDLSHVSKLTSMDAMRIATNPPIFSHSNPSALTPSPRCIDDDQIQAAVDLGGVIGISVYSPMCYTTPGVQPTLDDLLDRIDYVVEKWGIDHVAIGTDIFEGKNPILWRATTKRRYPDMVGDFEHATLHTKGYATHEEIRNVVYGLAQRGYEPQHIKQVLGENLLRIFDTVIG